MPDIHVNEHGDTITYTQPNVIRAAFNRQLEQGKMTQASNGWWLLADKPKSDKFMAYYGREDVPTKKSKAV